LENFTNQVKCQHPCRHQRLHYIDFLDVVCSCPESLLGEQWNVVVVTHIQHMETKWSETTKGINLIQNKEDREYIGPLALSMTQLMDKT
jgi:hypothetical protein